MLAAIFVKVYLMMTYGRRYGSLYEMVSEDKDACESEDY